MKTKKKSFLALSAALILGTQQSFGAAGIPTVDVGALTQSVMQYAQMGKDYAQQLKAYQELITSNLNMKKQMEELGIGMDIKDILGETQALIDSSIDLYGGYEIKEDLLQETADITNACSFLSTEIKDFGDKIQEAGTKLDNQVNACLLALKTDTSINDEITRLEKEAIQAEYEEEDTKKAQDLRHRIGMISKARSFLIDTKNSQAANKMLAFYDNYLEGDKTNPYSKEKLDEELKTFAKQLAKQNNSKQSQALMNALLLKILEMQQRQYELNLNFQAMQVNKDVTAQRKDKEQADYANEEVTYKQEMTEVFKDEIEAHKDLPYDDTGTINFTELLRNGGKKN